MTLKFKGIKKSDKLTKKYDAVFYDEDNDKMKIVSFGQRGASDYTIHGDENRRNRYINRHWTDLKSNDPTKAGYLSMFILWNDKNLNTSLRDYKRRYNQYLKTGKFAMKIKNMPTNLLNDLPKIGIV
jgi:hypothetical protein